MLTSCSEGLLFKFFLVSSFERVSGEQALVAASKRTAWAVSTLLCSSAAEAMTQSKAAAGEFAK